LTVLADLLVHRLNAVDNLEALLAADVVPHATLMWGKSLVDESAPDFLGIYAGAASAEPVRRAIEDAPVLVTAGVVFTDMVSGFFSQRIDPTRTIDVGVQQSTVGNHVFAPVDMEAALDALTSKEQQLVNQLTPVEQVGIGPGGGSPKQPAPPKYSGPTATQAQKAVQFAYDQLNCPYVYGGTGPCADGFDCSGLTQAAWAYAGVAIERTSEDEWDSLPHVSEADMEPGDIMVFNGAGHVGIYVGHGELIDAPHTGADVELVPFQGWYQETFDGAVRP
jgi:cell wall-associated NlpC family hydrolase